MALGVTKTSMRGKLRRARNGPGGTTTEPERCRGEDGIALAECEVGRAYEILSLPENGCAKKLVPLAIIPGSEVALVEKPPFGALMIERSGDRIALSRRLASGISVKRA